MAILTKVASLWKTGKRYAYRTATRWKGIRKIFVKVNGIWKKVYGLNAIAVYSLGLAQTVVPDYYKGATVNNSQKSTTFRSYNLVKFDKDGEMTFTSTYDIRLDFLNSNLVNTTRLVADLDAMPLGQLFTVYTYDEPQGGHDNVDLLNAMYRVGATGDVFGQPMAYRGAYLLVGKVGQPASYEFYKGEDMGQGGLDGDPTAVAMYAFTVVNNVIIPLPDLWTWGDFIIVP